jgi:hypothetical protein
MIAGAIVAVTQFRANDAWRWRTREMSSVVLIVACAVAQLIVAPRIARLRAEIAGPIEILPVDDARRVAFGRLHGVSVAWLGLAMLAAAVVVVIDARSLQSSDRSIHTL